MKIATWNINSVRLRLDIVLKLLKEEKPDVLCLQEIKAENAVFPAKALAALGYEFQAINGQRGYHGVATLSRVPFARQWAVEFCEKGDARHVAVAFANGVELHNFYVPSGGDVPDPALNEKFAHKLQFLDEMDRKYSRMKNKSTAARVLVGDLNIAPGEHDVWSHKQLLDVVSHTPIEVEKLGNVKASHDWVDVTREIVPEGEKIYSWWSYRARDWDVSDRGRRLDHVWVSPALKGAITGHTIRRDARGWEKPSDHVPVVVTLDT